MSRKAFRVAWVSSVAQASFECWQPVSEAFGSSLRISKEGSRLLMGLRVFMSVPFAGLHEIEAPGISRKIVHFDDSLLSVFSFRCLDRTAQREQIRNSHAGTGRSNPARS